MKRTIGGLQPRFVRIFGAAWEQHLQGPQAVSVDKAIPKHPEGFLM